MITDSVIAGRGKAMRRLMSKLKTWCGQLSPHTNYLDNIQIKLLRAAIVIGAFALSLAPGSADAAIGFVQGSYATPQSPQSLVSVTFTSAQQVGDLNVVVVGWNDTTAAVSS